VPAVGALRLCPPPFKSTVIARKVAGTVFVENECRAGIHRVSAFVPAFVAFKRRSTFRDKIAAFAENGIAFAKGNIAVEHGSIVFSWDLCECKKGEVPDPGKLTA
jgi:hypothetical protein